MLKFIGIFTFVFSTTTFAQTNVSSVTTSGLRKIELTVDAGEPKLGAQFWRGGAAVTFSVNAFDFSQGKNISDVALQFFNLETGDFIGAPTEVFNSASKGTFPNGGYQGFTLNLVGKEAATLTKNFRSSAILVIVTYQGQVINSGYIDLGSYCRTAKPTHFLTLETLENGCPKVGTK